ncbi:MAG: hypothetical protein WA419_22435 [Silvibacterium sp.]
MEYFLHTDQPHVISRAAVEQVGYYLEHRDMEECEKDYNNRWRDQTRFATAVFPEYYKRTYVHYGEEQSFRTTLFRYRVDAFLMPIAAFFKQRSTPLYRMGKTCIRTSVTIMEMMRIVR